MADVFLCPGLTNPNDVRLCPAGQHVVTYEYTGSGTLDLLGDAPVQFLPVAGGGSITPRPRRSRVKVKPATVYRYFATGRLWLSGAAVVEAAHATPWDEVIEAAWPELRALVESVDRATENNKVLPPVIAKLIESITITERFNDDDEILLMIEGLDI